MGRYLRRLVTVTAATTSDGNKLSYGNKLGYDA
jgi:hypothetical protein